jgi:hypothetical protein
LNNIDVIVALPAQIRLRAGLSSPLAATVLSSEGDQQSSDASGLGRQRGIGNGERINIDKTPPVSGYQRWLNAAAGQKSETVATISAADVLSGCRRLCDRNEQ